MKISNIISDLKFRYKLLLTYILLGFMPIAVLSIIWYNQTKEIVINIIKTSNEYRKQKVLYGD